MLFFFWLDAQENKIKFNGEWGAGRGDHFCMCEEGCSRLELHLVSLPSLTPSCLSAM